MGAPPALGEPCGGGGAGAVATPPGRPSGPAGPDCGRIGVRTAGRKTTSIHPPCHARDRRSSRSDRSRRAGDRGPRGRPQGHRRIDQQAPEPAAPTVQARPNLHLRHAHGVAVPDRPLRRACDLTVQIRPWITGRDVRGQGGPALAPGRRGVRQNRPCRPPPGRDRENPAIEPPVGRLGMDPACLAHGPRRLGRGAGAVRGRGTAGGGGRTGPGGVRG